MGYAVSILHCLSMHTQEEDSFVTFTNLEYKQLGWGGRGTRNCGKPGLCLAADGQAYRHHRVVRRQLRATPPKHKFVLFRFLNERGGGMGLLLLLYFDK